MIVETGRPVRIQADCTGGIERCFRCPEGSYLWAEAGELRCLAEVPDRPSLLPLVALGGAALLFGVYAYRRTSRATLGRLHHRHRR